MAYIDTIHKCPSCGGEFNSKYKSAKYCSRKCMNIGSTPINKGVKKPHIFRKKIEGTNIPDMSGFVCGRLTVIEYIPHLPEHGRDAFWLCKCECGNIKEVHGRNLRAKKILSCGCYQSDVTKKIRKQEALLRYGMASKKQVISHYKRNAKRANRKFSIDSDTFYTLTQMPCYFCGSTPSNLQRNTHNNGDYSYNGLDRLDNTLGYELSNVVPCCKKCNLAKHVMNISEFKEWIELVYHHLNKKISYGSADGYKEQVIRLN